MSGEDSSDRGEDEEEDIDIVRMCYDWASKAPSTAVAETVAAAADGEVNEMEPLYTYIEPDALDALVSPKAVGRCKATTSISFTYDGYDVTVLRSGEVSVRKNDRE